MRIEKILIGVMLWCGQSMTAIGQVAEGPLVQRLYIPAITPEPTLSVPLDSGSTYKIVASGTYVYGGTTVQADAAGYAESYGWGHAPLSAGYGKVFQLECPGIDWWDRPYKADHVYEASYPGQGMSVPFAIHDVPGFYGDNWGGLTVEIYLLDGGGGDSEGQASSGTIPGPFTAGTGHWTLIPNGGMEEDMPSGSNAPELGKFERSSSTSYSGAHSVAAIPAINFTGNGFAYGQNVPLQGGRSYVLSAFINTSAMTGASLYVDLNDQSYDVHSGVGPRSRGWVFGYATFTLPAGHSSVNVRFVCDGHVRAGELGYIDNVAITALEEFKIPVSEYPTSAPILDAASGHYYDAVYAPNISWTEACRRASSTVLGRNGKFFTGHLATIGSEQENATIVNLTRERTPWLGSSWWLGGIQSPINEKDARAGWEWVNNDGHIPGETSTTPFASWQPDEPNDSNYGTPAPGYEQGLSLRLNWDISSGWNDLALNNPWDLHGYIAEFSPASLRVALVEPSQMTREVGSTAIFQVRVVDPLNAPVVGAQFRVHDKMRNSTYGVESVSGSDGVAWISVTVPTNLEPGDFPIEIQASMSGYLDSENAKGTIHVAQRDGSSGITVIAHGFQKPGDNADPWMRRMGCEILKKAGRGTLWRFQADSDALIDATREPESIAILGQDFTSDPSGEQVFIIRWEKTASNIAAPSGEAEAVAHQVYSVLMGGTNGPPGGFLLGRRVSPPIHLIGHSFGCVVVSELAQRLGLAGVEVEHMTTLDPHDWDEHWSSSLPTDSLLLMDLIIAPKFIADYVCIELAKALGDIDGRALTPDVHVWQNIKRADNYFNRMGGLCPHGRDVEGTLAHDLTDLTGFGDAPLRAVADPHTRVHAYYLGTINPQLIGQQLPELGVAILPEWFLRVPAEETGFAFSRVGGAKHLDRFDRINAMRGVGVALSPAPTSQVANHNGGVDIGEEPVRQVFNGDLAPQFIARRPWEVGSLPETDFQGIEVPGFASLVAIEPVQGAIQQQFAIMLNADNSFVHTHLTLVPFNATRLRIAVSASQLGSSGSDDYLDITLNQRLLGSYAVSTLKFNYQWVDVPVDSVRGTSGRIGISLRGNGTIGSRVSLDDLQFIEPESPRLRLFGDGSDLLSAGQSVSFGTVVVGNHEPQRSITCRNEGGSTLFLSGIQLPVGWALQGEFPQSIAPGVSKVIELRLSTGALGDFAGSLTFDSNDPQHRHVDVGLSGHIVPWTAPARIRVSCKGSNLVNNSTTGIAVGSALLNGDPRDLLVEVANTGGEGLNVAAPSLLGEGFAIVDGTTATVAPGEVLNFRVRLNTDTIGFRRSVISIASSSALDNPFVFIVEGRVVPRTGSIQAIVEPPGAVTAGAKWRVAGSEWTPAGTRLEGLLPGTYRIESSSPPGWTAPPTVEAVVYEGQGSKVHLYYSPTVVRSIELRGDLTFEDTEVGTTSTRFLTIVNTGNVAISIIGLSASDGFDGVWSGVIAAGASQPIEISFHPTSAIAYSGVIRVATDAGESTVAAAGRGRQIPVRERISAETMPGTGGTVTGAGDFQTGTNCKLIATPDACYQFVNWTDGAAVVGTSPEYSFTVSSSRHLVAHFAIRTYNIVAAVSSASGGSVNGGGIKSCGETVTLTATPDSRHSFQAWSENGRPVSASLSYTFVVSSDRSIVASFVDLATGIDDGLVAWIPFNGSTVDATGNGHDGTAVETMPAADAGGEGGKALFFQGDRSYVAIKSAGELSFDPAADSYTVAVVFKLHALANRVGDLCILADRPLNQNTAVSYKLSVLGVAGPDGPLGALSATIWNGNQAFTVTTRSPIPRDMWVSAVFVVRGGQDCSLYVNGELMRSESIAGLGHATRNRGNITVGACYYPDTGLQHFNGRIDDVRIYARALPPDEVTELYSRALHIVTVGVTRAGQGVSAIGVSKTSESPHLIALESSRDMRAWSVHGSPFILVASSEPVPVNTGNSAEYYRAHDMTPPGFVWIPAGRFVMGSSPSEGNRYENEGPQTTVTLTRGFFIAEHETTRGQFAEVMDTALPTTGAAADSPIAAISWTQATNYCYRLTEQEFHRGRIPPGWRYRLPTEAEWEYAARAGTSTRFYWGDDSDLSQLNQYAWNPSNATSAQPVMQKQPNAWGLFDMSGNVWEYCSDWYGAQYPGVDVTDWKGPATGSLKVARGGSYVNDGYLWRSAGRGTMNMNESQYYHIGFRAVLSPVTE